MRKKSLLVALSVVFGLTLGFAIWLQSSKERALAQPDLVAQALSTPYGTLGATSQPENSVFDLVGGKDRYHDNLLTLENDSLTPTGFCGNAALRFRDSIKRAERGAFGYSSIASGCQHGFNPNTVYAEIGNIAPPGDPDDTSFAVVNTHARAARNFPGTSFKAFEIRGDTGDIIFRSADPNAPHEGAERLRIKNQGISSFTGGLSLKKRTISNGASDTAGMTDITIYWNSQTQSPKTQIIPGCNADVDGQVYIIKDEKGDANVYNITVAPASGTVEGEAKFAIKVARGIARLQCDSSSGNWNAI